jgi:hypothetical protein
MEKAIANRSSSVLMKDIGKMDFDMDMVNMQIQIIINTSVYFKMIKGMEKADKYMIMARYTKVSLNMI